MCRKDFAYSGASGLFFRKTKFSGCGMRDGRTSTSDRYDEKPTVANVQQEQLDLDL